MEDILALILIFVLILIVVYGAMHLKHDSPAAHLYPSHRSHFACNNEWDPLAMAEVGSNPILRYSKGLRFDN